MPQAYCVRTALGGILVSGCAGERKVQVASNYKGKAGRKQANSWELQPVANSPRSQLENGVHSTLPTFDTNTTNISTMNKRTDATAG